MAGLCYGLGTIKYNKTSVLECIDGTLNSTKFLDILKKRLLRNLPSLRNSSPLDLDDSQLLFQQDNSRVHTASRIKAYFEDRAIYVLPWPPKSSDLNLIEHVWARLKDSLKRSYISREELEDLVNAWESIPVDFIEKLYASMKDRIRTVIEAEGARLNIRLYTTIFNMQYNRIYRGNRQTGEHPLTFERLRILK